MYWFIISIQAAQLRVRFPSIGDYQEQSLPVPWGHQVVREAFCMLLADLYSQAPQIQSLSILFDTRRWQPDQANSIPILYEESKIRTKMNKQETLLLKYFSRWRGHFDLTCRPNRVFFAD